MSIFTKSLVAAVGVTCLTMSIAPTAQAGTLHGNWNYAIDAFNDGSGGAKYDIKGLAIQETEDSIWVALTGGTPITGVTNGAAAGGSISWGDLFFNFTGDDFQTASDNNALFGIRFADNNESGVDNLGIYSQVSATSVTTQNDGYKTLQDYGKNYGRTENAMGDLGSTSEDVFEYLSGTSVTQQNSRTYRRAKTSMLNVIETGNKIGDIELLDNTDLAAAGLDFENFNASGDQTFGFKFAKSFVPTANFIASVFLECGNDGVALKGSVEGGPQSVPEPGSLLGVALIGGLVIGSRRLRQKTDNLSPATPD
jgi:hypothetical protein